MAAVDVVSDNVQGLAGCRKTNTIHEPTRTMHEEDPKFVLFRGSFPGLAGVLRCSCLLHNSNRHELKIFFQEEPGTREFVFDLGAQSRGAMQLIVAAQAL